MTAPSRLLPVLLLLAACQSGGEGLTGATQTVREPPLATPAARSPAATPVPSARPAAPPLGQAAPESAAALLGADTEAVVGALGPPLLRRREGSAEIWLYAGPGCHLDIVFYPGEDGGAARVAHAAARIEGEARRSEAACLAGIARRPT